MTYSYQALSSPLGSLHAIADETYLYAIYYTQNLIDLDSSWKPLTETSNTILETTQVQLNEYFAQQRQSFDLPLKPHGTIFQQQAWQALLSIPYGSTRTYLDQAELLGKPKAVRAVGRANALNPISIIIPCHRVIGKSGDLTGYAGGLETKRFLLQLEGALLC